MKYLSNEDVAKTLSKIDKVDDKLDRLIFDNKNQHEALFKKFSKIVADLREEVVNLSKRFDNEQLIDRQRKARAIQQMKSE